MLQARSDSMEVGAVLEKSPLRCQNTVPENSKKVAFLEGKSPPDFREIQVGDIFLKFGQMITLDVYIR